MSRPLTVLTVDGIEPPPTQIDEAGWSHMQRLAAPLLNMAVLYATRVIRQGGADVRRQIHLDELHFFARWASGIHFFKGATIDSRKRNVKCTCPPVPGHLPRSGARFPRPPQVRRRSRTSCGPARCRSCGARRVRPVLTGWSGRRGRVPLPDGQGVSRRWRIDAQWPRTVAGLAPIRPTRSGAEQAVA